MMADAATPQKRVLPARERRESAAKRRAYSPAPVTAPTPAKKPPQTPSLASSDRPKRKYTKKSSLIAPPTPSNGSASPAPDELLPTKFTSAQALPTSRNKQTSQLSKKDYQSIADSAILAASLHRSRMQWLSEGVFKRYWVKPVKKKGVIDTPANNPDQKSMSRLGNGTITIEPHKFDVTFYVVREAQAPIPPYYRHPNQHTTKQPTYPSSPNYGFTSGTPVNASPATPSTPQTPYPTPTPAVKQETAPASPAPRAAASQTPRPPPKTGADPVIQMLAARAASDPHLKELMKVVATSKASPDQLKEFQKHIDEFNEVVKQQDTEREQQQSSSPVPAATSKPAPTKAASPATSHPVAYQPPKVATPAPAMPPPQYATYPTQPRPEPLIKHIVLEFHGEGASLDRWLFPEYAVLDIRYNGVEMTVSFFVERRGSEIIKSLAGGSDEETALLRARWRPDVEYYQPVTMHVRANQHKTVETIARGARTLPVVQDYMKKVMKDKTKTPEEFLVHQLPRDKPAPDFVDSAVELESDEEDDLLRDFYGN